MEGMGTQTYSNATNTLVENFEDRNNYGRDERNGSDDRNQYGADDRNYNNYNNYNDINNVGRDDRNYNNYNNYNNDINNVGADDINYKNDINNIGPDDRNYDNYDNYNHYNGSSTPTIFYGPNGGTAKINQTPNNNTIVITNKNGSTEVYNIDNNSDPQAGAYYGPNGGSAKIITNGNGKKAIEITAPNGSTLVYTDDSNNAYAVQDETINQYASDRVTNGADYNNAFSATTVTGPRGGQASTITGPAGNTYSTYDSSAYSTSLPPGIPRSLIPPGEEDLYILKSQVVPPVCPPSTIVYESSGEFDVSKCPPCKPCGRCPEPAFSCKKVPNYSAFNQDYMPIPVLSDFSSFGM